MKLQARRGSHLPVLIKLFYMTNGPILELGCGLFSTVFLFWACVASQRKLVTYDNEPRFYEWLKDFKNPKNKCYMDFHEIKFVSNWDDADLSQPWSLAFVDHGPDNRRIIDIKRLTHADYVVVHDVEESEERKRVLNGEEPISAIYPLFRYRYLYTGANPNTLILSNKYDLSGFHVIMDNQIQSVIPDIEKIVPETEMIKTHKGSNRRYTICRALREIFVKTDDQEIKDKLRYACTIAEYITAKVDKHDPGWLKRFYPFRRDWKNVLDETYKR